MSPSWATDRKSRRPGSILRCKPYALGFLDTDGLKSLIFVWQLEDAEIENWANCPASIRKKRHGACRFWVQSTHGKTGRRALCAVPAGQDYLQEFLRGRLPRSLAKPIPGRDNSRLRGARRTRSSPPANAPRWIGQRQPGPRHSLRRQGQPARLFTADPFKSRIHANEEHEDVQQNQESVHVPSPRAI